MVEIGFLMAAKSASGLLLPERTLDVRGNALIKDTLADLLLDGNRTV